MACFHSTGEVLEVLSTEEPNVTRIYVPIALHFIDHQTRGHHMRRERLVDWIDNIQKSSVQDESMQTEPSTAIDIGAGERSSPMKNQSTNPFTLMCILYPS